MTQPMDRPGLAQLDQVEITWLISINRLSHLSKGIPLLSSFNLLYAVYRALLSAKIPAIVPASSETETNHEKVAGNPFENLVFFILTRPVKFYRIADGI